MNTQDTQSTFTQSMDLPRRWFQKKRYQIPLILFLTPVALFLYWIGTQWRSHIISIETTGIVEPLTPQGTPDYETAFLQRQYQWQPEAFEHPTQNGFACWLALRGPRYLVASEENPSPCASEKSWPDHWSDYPTDPRTTLCWNRFWLPACARFQIDPNAEPPFLHYEDSLSAMRRQRVTQATRIADSSENADNSKNAGNTETVESPSPAENLSVLPPIALPQALSTPSETSDHGNAPQDSEDGVLDDRVAEDSVSEDSVTSDDSETILETPLETESNWREVDEQVVAYVDSLRSRPWLAAENPEAAEWLRQAEPGLNAWIETLQLPYDVEWDIVANRIDANLVERQVPSLGRQIEENRMVRDLLIRIQNRIALGNYDAAIDDLQSIDRVTQRARHSAELVAQLRGALAHRHTTAVLAQFLARSDLSEEQLSRLRHRQEMLATQVDMLVERVFDLDELRAYDQLWRLTTTPRSEDERVLFVSGGLSKMYYKPLPKILEVAIRWLVDPNEAGRVIHQLYQEKRQLWQECQDVSVAVAQQKERQWMDSVDQRFIRDEHVNVLGLPIPTWMLHLQSRSWMIGLDCADINKPSVANCRKWRAEIACCQREDLIAIVLEQYRRQYGTYPDQLSALVETHLLDALPTDPFSDQDFLYQNHPCTFVRIVGENIPYTLVTSPFVLYSVGENGHDDGAEWLDITEAQWLETQDEWTGRPHDDLRW